MGEASTIGGPILQCIGTGIRVNPYAGTPDRGYLIFTNPRGYLYHLLDIYAPAPSSQSHATTKLASSLNEVQNALHADPSGICFLYGLQVITCTERVIRGLQRWAGRARSEAPHPAHHTERGEYEVYDQQISSNSTPLRIPNQSSTSAILFMARLRMKYSWEECAPARVPTCRPRGLRILTVCSSDAAPCTAVQTQLLALQFGHSCLHGSSGAPFNPVAGRGGH